MYEFNRKDRSRCRSVRVRCERIEERIGAVGFAKGELYIAKKKCEEASIASNDFMPVLKVFRSKPHVKVEGLAALGVQCVRLQLLAMQYDWVAVREIDIRLVNDTAT